MSLRLPFLALSSVVALVRLLPMKDSEKDIEILPRGLLRYGVLDPSLVVPAVGVA